MSELASTAALDANVASAKKKVRRYRQMVMALRIAFGLGLVGCQRFDLGAHAASSAPVCEATISA